MKRLIKRNDISWEQVKKFYQSDEFFYHNGNMISRKHDIVGSIVEAPKFVKTKEDDLKERLDKVTA